MKADSALAGLAELRTVVSETTRNVQATTRDVDRLVSLAQERQRAEEERTRRRENFEESCPERMADVYEKINAVKDQSSALTRKFLIMILTFLLGILSGVVVYKLTGAQEQDSHVRNQIQERSVEAPK